VHRKYIPIYEYIQQDATLHSLFISINCSTCFGWYFHSWSGTHTTVSAASVICHTVTATCRYRGRLGTGLSVLWVAYPQHTQTGSNFSTIAAGSSNGVTNTRCCIYSLCTPDDGWKYHPKHVEQFLDINKLCNVASCWIYIGKLLGAHPILHISRVRVKRDFHRRILRKSEAGGFI
jgi:hypothetical protein